MCFCLFFLCNKNLNIHHVGCRLQPTEHPSSHSPLRWPIKHMTDVKGESVRSVHSGPTLWFLVFMFLGGFLGTASRTLSKAIEKSSLVTTSYLVINLYGNQNEKKKKKEANDLTCLSARLLLAGSSDFLEACRHRKILRRPGEAPGSYRTKPTDVLSDFLLLRRRPSQNQLCTYAHS